MSFILPDSSNMLANFNISSLIDVNKVSTYWVFSSNPQYSSLACAINNNELPI